MSKVSVVAAPQPRLLTVKTAAQYLNTSTWRIRELFYSKAIPHVRLGNKVYIDRSDLDTFIDDLKKAS